MTWARRQELPAIGTHRCSPPNEAVTFGDLWRCDECGELWRVGNSCDLCDPARPKRERRSHGGRICTDGLAWRPATGWQRWRNRKRGWQ